MKTAPLLVFAAGVSASSPLAAYWRNSPCVPTAPSSRPRRVFDVKLSVWVRRSKLVPTAPSDSTSSCPYHCADPSARR